MSEKPTDAPAPKPPTEEEKAKLRDALLSHGQPVPDCLKPGT